MKRFLLISLFFCRLTHAQNPGRELDAHLQPAIFAITMVMIHDVANPPAASRFYTYCLLGAQEIVSQNNKSIVSPTAYINDLNKIEIETKGKYDYKIAALYCILETGKIILPSGYMLEEDETKFVSTLKKQGYSESIIEQSILVAQEVAKKIIVISSQDNYSRLSTRLRYRPVKGEGYWYPTPPGYIEGVEPHWRTIRPVMIDSSSQFKPKPEVPFSKDTSSAFYKLAYEVYSEGKNLNEKNRAIASYWDCNPFAINTSGHMMIGFKKISPGGHWMNITSIATTKAKVDLDHGIMIHAIVAGTLMDAFISCWDEKYKGSRVRPETVINRYIDPRWQPLLQTPPFPEYTSGHSVISSAVAEVLTYFLGDKFAFTDNTEVIFELPTRDFTSFRQAADEASISRLYGGIHFRDAIVNGQDQGRRVGTFIIGKIKEKGVKPL
ncbi:vanadium-dependent haloperoxidase [Dyadobacter sp. CY356]|uniref:vanadium-dependent haloperoxidase n=1 Tax=Dyadobacter sp. CY356 TaxID=2906442 RepID=UPI001F3BA3C5|nr:vanadium-dependent haloperoxidase [Dyadobacter sp. CY356]MCF0057392.1 vanadium-dependent haloperoxidase [Dyadobacter sp. CY356]